MSDTLQLGDVDAPPIVAEPPKNRARRALLKRLADVVSLPSSRVNTFERSVTADLLVEILRDAEFEERARVARRLSSLVEIPDCLVRLILRDDIEIARPLLTEATLTDSDLLDCIRHATGAHRKLIALRRGLSELVSEALVEAGETLVVEALLRNDHARLSPCAVELVVAMTQKQPPAGAAAAAAARGSAQPRLHAVLVGRRRLPTADPPALRGLARGAAGGGRRRLPARRRGKLAGRPDAQGAAVHRAAPAQPRGHRKEPVRQPGGGDQRRRAGHDPRARRRDRLSGRDQADDRREDHDRRRRRGPGGAVQGHRPAALVVAHALARPAPARAHRVRRVRCRGWPG